MTEWLRNVVGSTLRLAGDFSDAELRRRDGGATVNPQDPEALQGVGLVSCGGQTAVQTPTALAAAANIDYIEVVTTAATSDIGPAKVSTWTRRIETAENAVRTMWHTQVWHPRVWRRDDRMPSVEFANPNAPGGGVKLPDASTFGASRLRRTGRRDSLRVTGRSQEPGVAELTLAQPA